MVTRNTSLGVGLRAATWVVVLGAWMTGPTEAENCVSAKSSVVFTALDASESPPGHQSETEHCFAGRLRGTLRGNLTLCIAEDETVSDDNLCACDSSDPIWESEGEGGALVYRSKSWFSIRRGTFEAVERGVQLTNTGYPVFPYPDPRQIWTGVMQILPDSGTGDYADFVYGTIVIHSSRIDPDKADLVGEICSP